MACVGIDFGNLYCSVAMAKRRGIDLILNENSKRLTSTLVSFQGKERFMGESAVPLARSNYKNTISNVKRLIGRKFSEPSVQADIETFLPFKVVPLEDDEIGIQVSYNDTTSVFTPQQVCAMMLQKLKQMADKAQPTAGGVRDVVITVPSYFTGKQRQAMLDAAHIANLKVLRLINETTSAALAYGIYKNAKGEFSEKPRLVAFVDMGHSAFNVAIVSFTKDNLDVLATTSDSSIGGRDVDAALARKLANEFKAKYSHLDAWANRKARLKLMVAAEKAKKTLSPHGVNETNVNLECLMEERDLSTKVYYNDIVNECAGMFDKMEGPIQQALSLAGIKPEQLHSVEVIGGGMRVRAVKERIAKVFGLTGDKSSFGLSSTLNMDECFARGAALQGAILSPTFRVKEFRINDVVSYPIRISWEQGSAEAEPLEESSSSAAAGPASSDSNSVVIFKQGSNFPFSRRVTFRRSSAFAVTATYEDVKEGQQLPIGQPRDVGRYQVSGIPSDCISADPEAPPPKIRVTFGVDLNGIFSIVGAQVFKELPPEPEAPTPPPAPAQDTPPAATGDAAKDGATPAADGDAPAPAADPAAEDTPMGDADGSGSGSGSGAGAGSEGDAGAAAGGGGGAGGGAGATTDGAAPADAPAAAPAASSESTDKPKRKKKFTKIDLSLNVQRDAMNSKQLMEAQEKEALMLQQDRIVQETQAKRNELESYVYDTRSSLYGLADYLTTQDSDSLRAQLDAAENWLYEDGFDVAKKVYQAKLDELRALADPVRRRKVESEMRGPVTQSVLADAEKFTTIANNTNEPYAHLTDEERSEMRASIKETADWVQDKLQEQALLPLNQDPIFTVAQVKEKHNAMLTTCNKIANKPKPAPKEEPKEADSKDAEGSDAAAAAAAAGAEGGDKAAEGKADDAAAEDIDMADGEEGASAAGGAGGGAGAGGDAAAAGGDATAAAAAAEPSS